MGEFNAADDTPDRDDDPGCGREVRKRFHARRASRDARASNPYHQL